MRLFDAHCHLQDERLDAVRDAVLKRAAGAGVERMVCCGAAESDWPGVLDLADKSAAVVPSFGLHPWYIADRTGLCLQNLHDYLRRVPSAVGEIGLDHAIEDRDDADQEAVFLSQLRLSRDLNLPVTMHCRRAWGRLLELLTPLGPHPAGMLIHSYSGADDLVPTLAKFNVFFSFSGSITFSGHRKRHRALRAVPLDRLLIETDAPDIPPYIPGTAEKAHGRDGRVDGWKDGKIDEGPAVEDPRREERPLNEPANLIYVAEAAARLLGVSVEELARLTWDNAERLFGPCVR